MMRAWGALALTLGLVVAVAGLATAQVNVQLSGTIESIEGPTLTLLTAAPPRRVTLGSPPPAPRPKLAVDLSEVPASQWVFLRPGERIAVVGLPSADGLRFAAIAIIGGTGPPRAPEAPQAP
jgi:hypothetical protein